MQPVGELATQVRGVSYKKADASTDLRDDTVGVVRAGNIEDGELVVRDLVYVPSRLVSEHQRLREGDVLIATSSGSLDVVGKAARVRSPQEVAFGAFCKVLRPGPGVDSGYFAHFFMTPRYRNYVSSVAAGANINNLRKADLDDLTIPLPPVEEQRRIAAELDKAHTLCVKRREALTKLDALAQAIFVDMFGDPVTNPLAWRSDRTLADVADLRSGITKGRKTGDALLREVPYLAVANVQDGHLKLDNIKTIGATATELSKYALRSGDVVLTEGGDPDKLGRGTVWREELSSCLHQNHVFRVRVTDANLTPEYISRLLGSQRGKRYFLRMAKQTTGIASINMTQLRGFPLLEPPLELQQQFLDRLAAVEQLTEKALNSRQGLAQMLESLQQRAFRGDL